jgi:hypothetical protein
MNPDLVNAIHKTTPDVLERPGAFDAIVIGAGAAGGLAAERLTQGGLKVLLLEAGFPTPFLHAPARRLFAATVSRIANPNFLPFMPPFLLFNGRRALRLMGRIRQRVQTKCYAWERRPDAFVDDIECPYTTPADRPFFWIRARALQGRVGIPGAPAPMPCGPQHDEFRFFNLFELAEINCGDHSVDSSSDGHLQPPVNAAPGRVLNIR